MDLESLKTSIESLAIKVENKDGGYLSDYTELDCLDTLQFCGGGYKGEISLHDVCLFVFKDVLKSLQDEKAILYWRKLPAREESNIDPDNGKERFKVRLRLVWLVVK